MGMVAFPQRIASAYVVVFGRYGEVSRLAHERGVCRQWIYREATALRKFLVDGEQRIAALQEQVRQLREENESLQERLRRAVLVDGDKQAELATAAQAMGVSLSTCWELLELLIPGQSFSVATLGRRTQEAGRKAAALLAVLDEYVRPKVREAAVDEIHVKNPVLMTVEPESLCWVGGRLNETAQAEDWAKELRLLPNLEQVMRDGAQGLASGVALVQKERQAEAGANKVWDQGDHFHALRHGGTGLRWLQIRAGQALAKAEKAQHQMDDCRQQGRPCGAAAQRARACWRKAEQAMDHWAHCEQLWRQTKDALQLFTPTGELNSRARAEAILAQTLAQLPDEGFSKSKSALRRPEMLNFLDRAHEQIEALPLPAALKQAALQQEGLSRRPEMLAGSTPQAATLRGILLMSSVILGKAAEIGQQALTSIRAILRRSYRASSLVECINSVLRMQQCRHRNLSQDLLDLKRLYWNCHTFRTGHRRQTTPYQRIGLPWPLRLRWHDLLKMTPEQLRYQLSTTKTAA
jgi:hypothetical protein